MSTLSGLLSGFKDIGERLCLWKGLLLMELTANPFYWNVTYNGMLPRMFILNENRLRTHSTNKKNIENGPQISRKGHFSPRCFHQKLPFISHRHLANTILITTDQNPQSKIYSHTYRKTSIKGIEKRFSINFYIFDFILYNRFQLICGQFFGCHFWSYKPYI